MLSKRLLRVVVVVTWSLLAVVTGARAADVAVHLTKNAQDVSGATLYAFSDTGTYLNQAGVTDATGHATFTAEDGQGMTFRTTSNSVYIWSAVATAPATLEFAIPVDTAVTVTKAGVSLAGLTVFAFDDAGVYLNYALMTDADGVVRFSFADAQNVKFRVTDGGVYCWSAVVAAPANVALAVPADTVVTVTKAGNPLAGLQVYAFDGENNYLNYAVPTDANGVARFTIPVGQQVKFRVTDGGVYRWSTVAVAPADVALAVPADTVVTVTKGGNPLAGLTVFAFDGVGNYLNYAMPTDVNGAARFTLAAGQQVKFRVTDGGVYHWSAVVAAPANVALAVPANTQVTVTKGGNPLAGLTVYAFDAANNYLNYTMTTNAAGIAEFALSDGQQVKFRITDGGVYCWSQVAVAPTDVSLAVPADTVVTVSKAGAALANRTVYAFDDTGSYLNYAVATDVNGIARFTLPEGLQVRFRVTDGGVYHWSPVATAPASVAFAVAADTVVTVTKGGVPLADLQVYLFDGDGNYLNYAVTTDANGVARFTIAVGQQVKFRVTDGGVNCWSAVATAPANAALAVPADTVVTVTKAGTPLPNLTAYLFDAGGNYLNYAVTTDANGVARFTIAVGQQVKFRVTDGDVYHWSTVATAPASVALAVPANTVVTVTKNGAPLVALTVFVFDTLGTYLNYARVTDSNGVAAFALAEGQQVKFRVTDEGTDQWSPVTTTPQAVAFTLGGGLGDDTTPPQIEITGVSDEQLSTQPLTPVIKVSDPNLAASAITLNGVPFVSGTTITADGDYVLAVTAQDQAGNQAAASVQFTIDGTPPEIVITDVTDGLMTNMDVTPVIAVTDAHPGETTILLDGMEFESGATVSTEGEHVLVVSATDALGNEATAVALSFTIDLTPPTASGLAPADGSQIGNTQPVISATVADNLSGVLPSSLSLELDGEDVTGAATIGENSISFTPPGALEAGTYTVGLMFSDRAGNLAWVEWSFEVVLPPVFGETPFIPACDLGGRGEIVELIGDNFTPATTVTIDGQAAEVIYHSAQKLYVRAPARELVTEPEAVDVVVANGPAAVTLPGAFEYLPLFEFTDGLDETQPIRFVSNEFQLTCDVTGGKPPYTATLTLEGVEEPIPLLALDPDSAEGRIAAAGRSGPPGESFNQAIGLSALADRFMEGLFTVVDARGNLAVKRYSIQKDTVPPAVPTWVNVYPDPSGTALNLLWERPQGNDPTNDAVQLEITWDQGSGPTTLPLVELAATPLPPQPIVIGPLTQDLMTSIAVCAIDRSHNKSQPAVLTQRALKLFDLHDSKIKVEEVNLALKSQTTGVAWSAAFNTVPELAQIRNALVAFDKKCVEDRSSQGPRFSTFTGYDTYGNGGMLIDTSWPVVPVPGKRLLSGRWQAASWETVADFVSGPAGNQVVAIANGISPWKPATSDMYTVSGIGGFYAPSASSFTSWQDCLFRVAQYSGLMPVPVSLGSGFGFSGQGTYNTYSWAPPWYAAITTRQLHLETTFLEQAGIAGYYWADGGPAAPGATIVLNYPTGGLANVISSWRDPQDNPNYLGVSPRYTWVYDNCGVSTANIYAEVTPRPLTPDSISFSFGKAPAAPGVIAARVGEAVPVSASVLYKNSGWNGTKLNGRYDFGEQFTDSNHNGVWDDSSVDANGTVIPAEDFVDEDAVFVSIPTTVVCIPSDGLVCNQGGPVFIGKKPGAYVLITPQTMQVPQGGATTINVLGIDVEVEDTQGNKLNEVTEDLDGAILPLTTPGPGAQRGKVKFTVETAGLANQVMLTLGAGYKLYCGTREVIGEAGGTYPATLADLTGPDWYLEAINLHSARLTAAFTVGGTTYSDSCRLEATDVDFTFLHAFTHGTVDPLPMVVDAAGNAMALWNVKSTYFLMDAVVRASCAAAKKVALTAAGGGIRFFTDEEGRSIFHQSVSGFFHASPIAAPGHFVVIAQLPMPGQAVVQAEGHSDTDSGKATPSPRTKATTGVQVDVEYQNLPEVAGAINRQSEDDPGGYVPLNNDDDCAGATQCGPWLFPPGNGTPDCDDPAPVTPADPSLIQIKLDIHPLPPEGRVTLSVPANMQIWKTQDKEALPEQPPGGWDLGNTDQRAKLQEVLGTRWLEGTALGNGVISLAHSALGNDSVRVTVFNVDLAIASGQEQPLLPEQNDEYPGAYTVANLNDTDGDGGGTKIDKDDNEVAKTNKGVDEVDLMQLVLRRPDPDQGSNVTLRVVSGDVKIWELPTKKIAVPLAAGVATFPVAGIDKVNGKCLWVEVCSPSSSLRDIALQLEYKGAKDRVRATGIWAGNPVFRNTGDTLPDDADADSILYTFPRFGGHLGATHVSPYANNGMLLEFTVTPPGIGTETDNPVRFDITRRMENLGWTRDGARTVPYNQIHPKMPEVFPLVQDKPNDHDNAYTVDVLPTNNHIYSLDQPGPQFSDANHDRLILRWNFTEFVRVKIGPGDFPIANGVVAGSRCSDFVKWRSRLDLTRVCPEELLDCIWQRTPAADGGQNEIELEHKPLGDAP